MTQDPTPHQTDIDSVIRQDEVETPPSNVAVATNGHTTKNGKAVVKTRVPAEPAPQRRSARGDGAPGLTIERKFTRPGEDVYSTVEWELRDAVIANERGEKVFEQKGVEIPTSWTQLATNVVVSKYFRGHLGTPERERSARQLIHRVADTIADWGRAMDYFATEEDAQAFQDELTHILLHQKAAFNSPVWFNVGLADQPQPQCSACFINSVEDRMDSILGLAKTEGMLFKYGSGTGTNLSPIRSSREPLQGGGTASGPVSFMRGFDQFAGAIKCLTPDAYVYTDRGMQTLGEVIDTTLPSGWYADSSIEVATKDAPTRISHIYVSPKAETYRMRLSHTGLSLRGTGEHPVLVLTPDFRLVWKRLSDLAPGERVGVSRRTEMWPANAPAFTDFQPATKWAKKPLTYPTELTPELARLLGYMVSEGCIDAERFRFCNADEEVFNDFLACVRSVFGIDPVRNIRQRVHPQTGVTTWLFEACWPNAVRFLQHTGLTLQRSNAKTVPWSIRCAPRALVVEFLRAYFEGDGHVSTHVYAASASETLLREVQLLLLNMGMMPLLRPHPVNGKTYWSLYLRGEQAWMFVQEVGFISSRKRNASQFAGDKNTNIDVVPFLAEVLRTRVQGVRYLRCADGVNRSLGFGFFNRKRGTAISYNRLRSTPGLVEKVRLVNPEWAATLETILEREFFWDTIATVEAAEPAVTYDFTVPGTHSFIANGIVNHNSGGKTRRAAKMVILDIDHPDIVDFITCKEKEEKKAWALIEAGYNGAFNVSGGAYDSVAFQNANHSVRVTDEFMHAYEQDSDWTTHNVLNKKPDGTYKARELMRMVGQSAWVCGDPGMQYDTTINKWHTCKNSDKIYASNPCSEYMFLNDSACNLASLNLMKFRREDGEFDPEAFKHACRILITAQEILVDNASYPTPRIAENSHDYRPLGLGYANLGALLMARSLPYDSDAGRAYAAAITAVMTGEAYHQSSIIARDHGWPFPGYPKNREPFLDVMRMHRASVGDIDAGYVPDDLLDAARQSWDDAIASGEKHGYRNAQATVLAPTGCLVGNSLVLTDRGLMRLSRLGDVNGNQWQDVRFNVLTDEGERAATQFYVNGVEATRRLTTRCGYAIQGTLKHRVKVVDPTTGEMRWKRFADMAPGDVVALSMGQLVGEPRTVHLPPLGEEYWTGDYTTRVPRTMTPELAELVGYFMGDGSLHAKGPRFCVTNADVDVAERLRDLMKSLFNLEARLISQQGYCEVSAHSVPLTLWWEACGFSKHLPHPEHTGKGYRPYIPDAILATNDPMVYGAFLRGLYEADGTITNGIPCWVTTHREFSEEVKTVLLALGIPTTTKRDTSGWGRSAMYGLPLRNKSYVARFMASVGFIGARKSAAARQSTGNQAARYDHIYLDPAVVRELVPPGSPLENAVTLSMRRHNGAITRRAAETLYAQTGDARLGHALRFFYDTIAANEDGGEQLTYDLSVPSNVTYIAGGFISHNTIGFLMDCDTTGIEPDIAIVKYKSLVGGGVMKIVNNTVPEALQRLGYTQPQIDVILAYIDAHDTIEGAPELKPEHLPIFDCAFKPGNGTRSIHYMGHVRMMAAAQPFISGAISKTVNMPNTATVEEIIGTYVEGWKLGLKAIAIYRDGSKRTQPLMTKKADEEKTEASQGALTAAAPAAAIVEERRPVRRKLPDERRSITHKFSIAGHEGYITVGMYEDGTPGEIFLTMSKEGSTISGLMDSFATAISLALQYGVPLQTLVDKFGHTRFEPSGITNNPDIRFAKSIMDYIFRWLGVKFLSRQPDSDQPSLSNGHGDETNGAEAETGTRPRLTLTEVNQTRTLTEQEREIFQNQADAPICTECGSLMVRNGACFKCLNCGSVFGCS